MKTKILLSTLLMTLAICLILYPSTAKAGVSNFEINGTTWVLTTFDDADGHICLKVGDNDILYLDNDDQDLASAGIINVGLDTNSGTVYVLDSNHAIRWWNYNLQDHNSIIFKFIPRPTTEDNSAYVDDVSNLVLDYSNGQRLITGYETFSGETCPLLTLDKIKEYLGISDQPTLTPSEITPKPITPPNLKPSSSPSTPSEKPPVSKTDTNTNTKVNNKVSLVNKGSYKCISVGGKVVSKYKLKKGVLTWKGSKKSKKVKPIKRVKQVGFIKKSKNLIYITKKGKAYTISPKGKKKTIVKKGAKKLIFKGKFVTKVKKKSGYTNVVNK